MKKKTFLLISAIFAFIVISVIYNYILAQKAIKETRPSILTTDIVSYPETLYQGKVGTFMWNVQTPSDLSTTATAIYWGYQSTPSAVTVNDPPQSLAYSNNTSDYLIGTFKLPDTFDDQIKFDRAGKIFFRSYAKVGNLHLWSKEYQLTVLPSQE